MPPLLHPLGLFSGGTCPQGGLRAELTVREGGPLGASGPPYPPGLVFRCFRSLTPGGRMRQGTEVEVVAQAGPALRRAVDAGRQVGQRKWLFFSRPSGPSGRLGAE